MPAPPGTSELAAFLRRSGASCVERWVDRIRDTSWGGAFEREQLRDNHPRLVETMIELAEAPDTPHDAIREVARAHAGQRHALGYDLEQLLWENALFRRTLLERLDQEGVRLPGYEKSLMHESLDIAAVESTRFFATRETEREQALRTEAEDALIRNEEILARITEGFFATDTDFRLVYLNPAGERILARTRVDVDRLSLWDAFPGSAGTALGQAYRQAMATGQPVDAVYRYEPWDRWFSVRAYPGPTGLSVYFRDETERLQRDRERERILEVVERGDAAFVTDRDFRIVFVNATQEALTKTSRHDTLGRNLWEAFPVIANPERKYWREYHRVMDERVPVQFDEFYEPQQIWTGVTAYPTREGGMAAFFRDITGRKQAEQLQERLLGVVGHDLRNPLTAARLGIHRVTTREELAPSARRTLERSLRSIEKMERMITALLDYSRVLSGGGIAVERRPADMAQLLRDVEAEFAESHPGRVHVTTTGPMQGTWDADRIEQVLSNLMSNALRHGAPERPVTVRAEGTADQIRIEVHNEGPPIPAEMRSQLFEAFHPGRSGGMGLGLYISCNIARQHGGSVELESRDGHGTTFTVRLPRC